MAHIAHNRISRETHARFLTRTQQGAREVEAVKLGPNVEHARLGGATTAYWYGKGSLLFQGPKKLGGNERDVHGVHNAPKCNRLTLGEL